MTRDRQARERIQAALDDSLLVEAAAGTGKTTQLIGRLVAVLASGRTTVDRVVAVTFTRKAAGEIKLRLRQELDRARAAAAAGSEREHLEAALARLEEASIGTIHSFCAELLRERPVEAGIDPGFEEIDEDEAGAIYDRAFRAWIERELGTLPPALQRALSRLTVMASWDGSPAVERLRRAGRVLLDWRDFPAPWRRDPFDREAAVDRVAGELMEVGRLARHSRQPKDPLRRALAPAEMLTAWIERSEAAAGRRDYPAIEARLLAASRELDRARRWKGRGELFAPGLPRREVAAARDRLLERLREFREQADADLAARLKGELDGVVRDYEGLKARAGKLDFLDLLLKTRDLLRSEPVVRRFFQERFTHLFVDEFQDTDPLQAEILLLLSADDPAEEDWRRVRPSPGKLFLVGDPKQSIYRFRRADVRLYQQIKRQLEEAGVGVVYLTRSFRAVAPLQAAVNAAFAGEMVEDEESGQADYVPLEPHREAPADQPALVALPAPTPYGRFRLARSAIDRCLPDTAAAFLDWLLGDSGWTVEDPETRERVPVAARHVAILFRRYLSWREDVTNGYVQALEKRGIPHVLVGGRSLHQREEVESLRVALTAVEWPDDELSVFATLKGPLFAVPDELLLRYRDAAGSLHPFRRRPADLDPSLSPVAEALDLLAGLHRSRNRLPAVATLNRLLTATRAHAGLALRPAGARVLANVQQISDLARRWEAKGGLSFRGFVEHLAAEAEHMESRQLPVVEEGAEAVRIMTVHAAKGLEFPVVLLADPSCNLSRATPGLHADPERALCVQPILGWSPVELLEAAESEVARDRAEGLRVAYVAATRARDLLVVPTVGDEEFPADSWLASLHKALYPHPERARLAEVPAGGPRFGDASVLARPQDFDREQEFSVRPGLHRAREGGHPVVWWDPACLDLEVEGGFGLLQETILAEDDRGAAAEGVADYREWQGRRSETLDRGSRPLRSVRPVTELTEEAPGAERLRLEVEVIERDAGRPAGARFGTLVHSLLRDADLGAGEAGLRSLAAYYARVLQATDEEREAAVPAVERALRHPLLERARAAPRCRRELPLLYRGAGDLVVEGVADLVFDEGDGLTLVDFKTDVATRADGERYRRQLGWYAHILERLTGSEVRAVLLGV